MVAFSDRGWWHPADTIKERIALETAYRAGYRPWALCEGSDQEPSRAIAAELER